MLVQDKDVQQSPATKLSLLQSICFTFFNVILTILSHNLVIHHSLLWRGGYHFQELSQYTPPNCITGGSSTAPSRP